MSYNILEIMLHSGVEIKKIPVYLFFKFKKLCKICKTTKSNNILSTIDFMIK